MWYKEDKYLDKLNRALKIDNLDIDSKDARKIISQKFNDFRDYKCENIESLDITSMSIESMNNYFFHYSWKKFLETFDKEGMIAIIGENSHLLDSQKSLFFSKGVEGVLELWDVWLKWRLDRLNNPMYKGNNQEEIDRNILRHRQGMISQSEKLKYDLWYNYFSNKKFLEDDKLLQKTFDYQYIEMINSDYFVLDLKENDEFIYNQIDIKKPQMWNGIQSVMYGDYSNLESKIADKWNMQTIPGKDVTIEPSRIKRIVANGKTDVFSILKLIYEKYKTEVPFKSQVKFDLLDKYVDYCKKKIEINPNKKIELLENKKNLLQQKQLVDNQDTYQQEQNAPTLKREKSGFINALLLILLLVSVFSTGIILANLLI